MGHPGGLLKKNTGDLAFCAARSDGLVDATSDEALGIENIVQHLNPVRMAVNPVRTLIIILLRTFSQ